MRIHGSNVDSHAVTEDRTGPLLVALNVSRCETERARLTEEIVLLNLRFCDRLAGRFARKGAEWEDLVQVARTALLLAVQRFEPDRGLSFHALAAPTVTGELKRFLRDHCWSIRPPRGLQELRGQIRQVGDSLTQRLGHAPGPEELAGALGVSASRVREATAIDGAFRAVSLDFANELGGAHAVGTEAVPVSGAVAGDDDDFLNCLILRSQLKTLSVRERQILIWRFRDDCTQTTIAARLGVSQMQVSRTLARLLARLRCAMVQTGSDGVAFPDGSEFHGGRSAKIVLGANNAA